MFRTRLFLTITILLGSILTFASSHGDVSDRYEPTTTTGMPGSCIAPAATFTFQGNCEEGDFYIHLDVTSLGDSPSLTVEVELWGFVEPFPNVPVGELILGPYFDGDFVTITLLHATDPACNVVFADLEPAADCPFILPCGFPAVTFNHCYDNNEVTDWSFVGIGDGSFRIHFLAGTIQSAEFDQLVIYDGLTTDSPILYQHAGQNTQNSLADLIVFSSGPQVMMVLTTNATNSCVGGTQNEWSFQVACLDCALPMATVAVMEDCDTGNYTIDMNITSTGEGSVVDVVYTVDGLSQTLENVTTGPQVLGPYQFGQVVNISLAHELDALCDVNLGNFTDSGMCPTLVVCGADPISESYCYVNNDSQFWFYQLVGTDGPLYMQFNAGSIESAFYDQLTIYDGPDANSPILFNHTELATIQLAGLSFFSTTGTIFMTMSSDPSVSCAATASITEWEWLVTCLDCTPPVATFDIVQDCENFQYYIDINISAMGSDPEITITNTLNATTITAIAPGNILAGPFTSGVPVRVTLVNDDNVLCNVSSPMMVNPLCPTFVCGTEPLVETYCYGPNENMAWAYEVDVPGQVRLKFNQGSIENSNFDKLIIYDGPDDTGAILFSHTQTTTYQLGPVGSPGSNTNYYGVDVTASGQNIYMTLTTDGSVHCTTSSTFASFEWEVNCVGCTPPGLTFEMLPNCDQLSYQPQVVITEVGPLGFQVSNPETGQTISVTEPGTYTFEFYHVDSTSNLTVVDLDNSDCTYTSGPMIYTSENCIIASCGVDSYSLCYENGDERWYTYKSEGDYPISIFFLEGRMLPGDHIVLFNSMTGGPDDFIIYSGNNNGGNLLGITANSSNPDNALTLLVRSDQEGSCADGSVDVPLHWTVGCGFVGIDEATAGQFLLYPNPSEGQVSVEFGDVPSAPVMVKVMDMSGRVTHEQMFAAHAGNKLTMDLGTLQNGQYLLYLFTDQWISTKTFQILR